MIRTGDVYAGPRAFQQFHSTDQAGVETFSRSCTVEQGVFVLVHTARGEDGKLALEHLSADDRRFVTKNVTPAEHRAKGKTQNGLTRAGA